MPSNLEWPLELQGLHPVCTWLKCTPESSNARPTMHNARQSPAATTELTGAGFRFRPLKVDDPESFGCEAAEPIRMHSLETRPLLCLYWPRLEISLCGQELGTDSSDSGPGAATGLPPIDCAAWRPWKACFGRRHTHNQNSRKLQDTTWSIMGFCCLFQVARLDDMRHTHIRAQSWAAPLQKMLAAEAGPGAKPSHASLPLLQESRPMKI